MPVQPYFYAIEDLADDYRMDRAEKKQIESIIVIAILGGNLDIYDINEKKVTLPITGIKDRDKDVQLSAKDVNMFFAKRNITLTWTQKGRRGRKRKPGALARLRESGKLKNDALYAVNILRNNKYPTRRISTKMVAGELMLLPPYKKYKLSSLCKYLVASWWKEL